MKRNVMFSLIIIFILVLKTNALKLNAYTDNGHENIESVEFYEENRKLLYEIEKPRLMVAEDYVKKSKFWGWRTYYFNCNEQATYIGEVVFSRSNNTSNDVKYSYSIKETNTLSTSISVSDALTAKGSGGKKITLSLQNDLKVAYEKETTHTIVESLDYQIVVPKGKKVTVYTYGDCLVSSGLSCHYIFWIRTKFGSWEIIDLKTIYYQMTEEVIR